MCQVTFEELMCSEKEGRLVVCLLKALVEGVTPPSNQIKLYE
jgi:hypothetical protein